MSHEPLDWIDTSLQILEESSLLRRRSVRMGPQAAQIEFEGQQLVNFGSNDYLGLACDERVLKAALQCMQSSGWGAGASSLVTGRGQWHAQLEQELAQFEETEAALLFPTGYAANVGTIAALVEKGDAVYSDAKNHASIIDGCRLSGAAIHVYPHNDSDRLDEMLKDPHEYRRRLIVSDGLFSMDGDLGPIGDLARLAAEHGCMLLVDEAHATCVIGDNGRGVSDLLYAEEGVHVKVGTLSKALGSAGGFVAGSRRLIDYLTNAARSYIFSTALPEANAAAALAALQIARQEPQRRELLQQRADTFRERLWRDGWWLGSTQSHIVPIVLGDPNEALRMSAGLRQQGFYVPAIRPPSVPEDEALLRISVTYLHDEALLDRLADALMKCAELE